jgi:hypothetical protein
MDAASGPASLPRGYPAQYRQDLVLRDGRRVLIRPILPSDAPELADAIKTADADTLRRRFLGGPPRITPELLAHLTVVDYVRRFALVAVDTATQRGVAISRYEPAGEDVAEIAVAVRPDLPGNGDDAGPDRHVECVRVQDKFPGNDLLDHLVTDLIVGPVEDAQHVHPAHDPGQPALSRSKIGFGW